jgi:hypothetical protein
MSELMKVKQECEKYLLNIMQVDAEISNTYTKFFASTVEGVDRYELLDKFESLVEKRKELDSEVAVVQAYFSHIVSDIESNKMGRLDKWFYNRKMKKMIKKLKGETVIFDEEILEETLPDVSPAVDLAIENAMKEANEEVEESKKFFKKK